MPDPILSIIMPVYNAEAFVEESIKSILAQTFADFELIVVVDGSTDRSIDVVRNFADQRIRILTNEANRGIVYSRNRGLELAAGKYIAPFDADDMAHPRKFEKQIAFLESHPEYGMVGAWARLIDAQGKMLKKKWKLNAPPERIPAIMLFRNYFVQSAVVIRREAIPQGGYKKGFDTVEDYLMWTEVVRKFKVWNLPEYLVNYRMHAQGMTSKEAALMPERDSWVYTELFKRLQIDLDEHRLQMLQALKDSHPIRNLASLRSMEVFLLHILKQNHSLAVYDHRQLKKVVFNRWIKTWASYIRSHTVCRTCFLRIFVM